MRTPRLAERMRRLLAPDPTRRDLLERLALGATALSVAPLTYALRPVTATAAIVGPDQCPRGSNCTDGYTDFCCAVSSWGRNLCPPGTVVAGWWKADGSGFCDIDGPRPRYYLDCNQVCDPDCDCGLVLCNPDFATFAEACGGFGAHVHTTDAFMDAFTAAEDAAAQGRPALLHVHVSSRAIAPGVNIKE